ncbi:hypothetical protein ATCC90586_009117 [Pythium insidiosum]|nr:hypothetical protein ATCC90586_009117 [Pythium insidiosum]
MKRRLPASARPSALTHEPAAFPAADVNVERRGDQIVPLHEDPALQSLTPRSLARSVAELDALRSRVQELEQKLSQHDVALLPTDLSRSSKRLPPLSDARDASPVETAVDHATPAQDRKQSLIAPVLTVAPPPSPPRLLGAQDSPSSSPPIDAQTEPARIIYASTTSPHREQAKILLEPEGDAVFAVSRRNRLYQILKRVSATVAIPEDQLLRLKKLVDAEIGDVITFLLSVEHETESSLISTQLAALLESGSPSKHRLASVPWPIDSAASNSSSSSSSPDSARPPHDWTIQYPLQKVAHNLEQLRVKHKPTAEKTDVIVLVSSGAYNPIHMLHIRALYVARQYVESNYKFPVVGAFVSPSHDTYVRVKNRRKPHEMIPKRHRLGLIEAAVASSSWIEVDKWEITRRRVLDYLSTLTHVRDMCETHFPAFRFHVMYVCGCNTVVKLSHTALRDEGFGCITVCRPTQTAMVLKHLGKTLVKTTTVVEDTGVLPVELERASSFRVRQAMMAGSLERQLPGLEMMVGKPALQYLLRHLIPAKVAGMEPWTEEDKAWRDVDVAYVEYMER